MRPNYIIVGAAKCGTTSLAALLGQHPDVFMTEPKEPNFFCWDEFYSRGFEWYEALYEGSEGMKARGEASVYCSVQHLCPNAADRIAACDPKMKIIYIVRHPLKKLESTWMQWRSISTDRAAEIGRVLHLGDEPVELVRHSFADTLRDDRMGLVRTANYWREISVYRERFSDDQILVLFLEDMKTDRAAILRRCFEFLGVDPDVEVGESKGHLNRAVDKTIPRPFFSKLRLLPGIRPIYRRASKIIPESVRMAVSGRLLRVPVKARPEWEDDLRKNVVDSLEEDVRTFLEFYGKPADFWSLHS